MPAFAALLHDPLTILLVAMTIVVGGILLLRLHAFVALFLAGLTAAAMTPAAALQAYAQQKIDQGQWTNQAAAAFVDSAPIERVLAELGSTAGKLAVLIGMAAIIGKCLLESGAADRIVRRAVALVGQRRAPLAMLASSFLLAIPVFFDTVFYLMIPLGKALRLRTGRNYLLYVLAIFAGGTMAHSLVPPTPGPLLVAGELGVNLGVMIVGGCFVGLFTSTAGYLYAVWANRRWDVPLRDTDDLSLAQLQQIARRDERELPPLWLSLLPIVLPVVLITAATAVDAVTKAIAEQNEAPPNWLEAVRPAILTLGNANIALTLAAAVALATLVVCKRASRAELGAAMSSALVSAGVIVLITAAGGGFGGVLRQTGIAARIGGLLGGGDATTLIPLAFCISVLVRTAQGSATVAMITSVGIVGAVAFGPDAAPLEFHPVYLALAIGCGSKPISWMNDSGFWVVCKMSGLTEQEGLRTITPMSAVMGLVGLVVVMLLAWLLPMAPVV